MANQDAEEQPILRKLIDTVGPRRRSEIMARVRSPRNLSTEWKLRSFLIRSGLKGWRVTLPGLVGNPDFAFPKKKVAVFVDGCFWHGCPKCYRAPKSQKEYWSQKIESNRSRDKRVRRELVTTGWRVLRIWECDLEKHPDRCVKKIGAALAGRHRKNQPKTAPNSAEGKLIS